MKFFEKLKTRLFGSKEEKEELKKIELQKKTEKLEKKIEKDLQKRLIKEDKLDKYVEGLKKSNVSLTQKIINLQNSHKKIDEELFEELEEILIMSDISFSLVEIILYEIKKEVKNENINDPKLIGEIIADKIYTIYANNSIINTQLNVEDNRLNVILMVGVNGSGKTTSISKIAKKYCDLGKKVLIAAGDTFRAAAVEQLKVWAERAGADIVVPNENEYDPGSIVYRSLDKAIEENYDLLIIDTAGRLQNKVNLMNELAKINNIIHKRIPEAPHDSLLVIDATTGQNGISQAKHFKEVTPISGIVLTKMDGTSKGGIILSIKEQLDLNVKLIGLGEKMEDLQEFDLDAFIYALTKGLIEV
ncbi:signal recognition particle-docking protein FtsY [Mesomycoplasma lagogenitalium]|uniref:Signal recognition particle receptor FtsY n=1 Tax=Mesomycoplasma lagogenitalium TaxID=171286 RepID=A0ABY8LW49_9BACT|nr:signal recognition particle-docking protein FtsY [Mesomycoplasma lagogenitalium]WGI36646.1 signal recognition particle-docking protein FtsY [Mesomycoplasma lagogenitalium]